jgi:L-ribulose-5-phosphate 3-epimerase
MHSMNHSAELSRRSFVQVAALGACVGASWGLAPAVRTAQAAVEGTLAGRIYKSLKIGMVRVEGSLVEKFQAVRQAGFDGIEMDAPGMDVERTREAIAQSGLMVDGTVCSTHWQVRHTSPDAAVRRQALANLETAIRDTHAVGGHSVLLVPGHGQDGPEEEIWPRAVENISRAIPLAARLGVYIAIENVWNHFLYDHQGGPDQTAEKFVQFIDAFQSPWVGMHFDIGNHWKYGDPAAWIRQLGKRIVKLDVKGFSRKENRFTPIQEGDIVWQDVRQALMDIGFAGWAAAEVAGGDRDVLRSIATAMDQVLGLVPS